MRNKQVKVTLIDGTSWYVPSEEFNSFDVPETPESVLSSFIRGSKGPLVRVNATADMSGAYTNINANFIVYVDVVYV